MLKKIVAVVIVLSCCGAIRADYLSDRKAAMNLVRGGTNEEALAIFNRMAEGQFSDLQKSDALEQAALCANRLKQYDQALALAKRIPLEAVSKKCRMNLMRENRKYTELITEFKGEDIEHWPESARGDAFYSRGIAYYHLKDGKSAEADLKKAVDYTADEHTMGIAWLTLGHNYRSNLKDDQKALEAYAQVIKMIQNGSGRYYSFTAVSSASAILCKQGKYDEARQTLKKMDIGKMRGDWLGSMLCAYGKIYESQGKKAEAIAKYKEAAAVTGLHASQKAAWEKKFKELEAGGNKPIP